MDERRETTIERHRRIYNCWKRIRRETPKEYRGSLTRDYYYDRVAEEMSFSASRVKYVILREEKEERERMRNIKTQQT